MAFTDMDEVEQEYEEEATPAKSSNRNFWIIFGILGGIIILALLCLAGIALILPGRENVNATRAAQLTEISYATTQTASAPRVTPTNTAVPPTRTRTPPPTPTNTPLVPLVTLVTLAPTNTATSVDSAIATRSALLTQAAEVTAVTALPSSTLLPSTGFADEVGMPGLLVLALVFVVVIFLVRRLRFAGPKSP